MGLFSTAGRYLERVITGAHNDLYAKMIRGILWPLSMLYCAGLNVYLWTYKKEWRKQTRLDIPVISIGNLTFGGTGKTPAVITICRILTAAGHKPVVLSRGHGGSSKNSEIVSNGEDIIGNSRKCGDEPLHLARCLFGIPVVIGRDRRKSGRLACDVFKPTIIVMDDGMQYWQLHRNVEIAVMNAERPFGSGLVMPAGDLREPIKGLRRATAILANDFCYLDDERKSALRNKLKEIAPDAALFPCVKSAAGLVNAENGDNIELPWLRGRTAVAFCGIGNPDSFRRVLDDIGTDVKALVAFADHKRYTDADITSVIKEKEITGAEILITTEKDFARLDGDKLPPDLYILKIELEIEDSKSFEEYITYRINRANQKAAI